MSDEMNNEVFIDNEDEESIITLIDDEGAEVEFALLDAITMDDKEYVVLMPLEDEDEEAEEAEVVIMELETDAEGNESFIAVEDDAIAEKVFEIFQADEDEYEFGDAE